MPSYDRFLDDDIKADKTNALLAVIAATFARPERLLVVGCGSGREAGLLARGLVAETVGIDICDKFDFDHAGSAPAKLVTMDARALDFPTRVSIPSTRSARWSTSRSPRARSPRWRGC